MYSDSMNPPTPADFLAACAVPLKGARAYARTKLEANLELVFIRTNGRRSEPLEAWYVGNGSDTLRIDETQVVALLKLWAGTEISTVR
ncbi:MAG: hypothetical protein RLZZ156_2686 [Deinococcota bacterium]